MTKVIFSNTSVPRSPIPGIVEQAKEIEDVGVDIFFVADESPSPPFRDIWGVLYSVAANTKKIQIGTSIIPVLARHPAHTAVQLSSLDEVAGGGRVILGIGPGGDWTLKPIGIDIKQTKPVGMMREATKIFRKLFKGEVVDTKEDGLKYYQLNNVKLDPRPQNDVKIYFGVRGPMMLGLAGKIADGIIIGEPQGFVADKMKIVKAGADKVGRTLTDFDYCNKIGLVIAKDGDKARTAAKRGVMNRFKGFWIPDMSSIGIFKEDIAKLKEAMKKDYNSAPKFVTDEMVKQYSIAGTVTEVMDQIEEGIKMGVKHYTVGVNWGPEKDYAKQVVKEKIIPSYRE
ncbi:MAG: LLM class flavin-dependent oxidoreductase [Candidatus Ranarchaeia archaeon]